MTTITEIFREVYDDQRSFSEARRQVHMDTVRFNTKLVTSMTQEVEVKDSSVFEIGTMSWVRDGNKWIRELGLNPDTQYTMDLLDQAVPDGTELNDKNSTELYVRRSNADALLMIGAFGYGEKTAEDGKGYPIVIEFHEGELVVRIWADINDEEPTHKISLEGARENVRKDDGN